MFTWFKISLALGTLIILVLLDLIINKIHFKATRHDVANSWKIEKSVPFYKSHFSEQPINYDIQVWYITFFEFYCKICDNFQWKIVWLVKSNEVWRKTGKEFAHCVVERIVRHIFREHLDIEMSNFLVCTFFL